MQKIQSSTCRSGAWFLALLVLSGITMMTKALILRLNMSLFWVSLNVAELSAQLSLVQTLLLLPSNSKHALAPCSISERTQCWTVPGLALCKGDGLLHEIVVLCLLGSSIQQGGVGGGICGLVLSYDWGRKTFVNMHIEHSVDSRLMSPVSATTVVYFLSCSRVLAIAVQA